jgi:hypothetical protein
MTLQAPTRVNYFTGQFLDAADFRDEQDYQRGRHQRLSRLAVGSGVLCGLEVTATADGQVVVEPGIAIDGLGREIVLGAPHVLADPFQPTDEDGQPRGARVADGTVTLLLCYAERAGDAEPEPGAAAESDDQSPDRTVEGFRIVIREGEPPLDPGLSSAQAAVFLPAAPRRGFDRRVALYEALDRSCQLPEEAGVVLASIGRSKTGRSVVVDQGGRRRDIYSVAQLLDLILSLADRLTAVEGALSAARGKAGG